MSHELKTFPYTHNSLFYSVDNKILGGDKLTFIEKKSYPAFTIFESFMTKYFEGEGSQSLILESSNHLR